MKEYREQAIIADAEIKRKESEQGPKASYGYGGKFGVQKDRSEIVFLLNLSFFYLFWLSACLHWKILYIYRQYLGL